MITIISKVETKIHHNTNICIIQYTSKLNVKRKELKNTYKYSILKYIDFIVVINLMNVLGLYQCWAYISVLPL